jgi:hypothetical protein
MRDELDRQNTALRQLQSELDIARLRMQNARRLIQSDHGGDAARRAALWELDQGMQGK